MVDVASDHGVTALALARALIDLGGCSGLPVDAVARRAVLGRWGPGLS